MKLRIPSLIILCLPILAGCALATLQQENPLSSVAPPEAARLISTPARRPIEGTFSSVPEIEKKPSDDPVAHLVRESLEDFLHGTWGTPHNQDRVVIRQPTDASIAFIFMEGDRIGLSFLASTAQNRLTSEGKRVSLVFDTAEDVPSAVMKTWSSMTLESVPDGSLEFRVSFRERMNEFLSGLPYSRFQGEWIFRLKRLESEKPHPPPANDHTGQK